MEYKHNNGPFLIVAPITTLSNWVNEFNKWAPEIIKVVYKGTPDERKRIFKEEIESHLLNALITTYEYIMKDKSSLKKLTWQYIIVDEGHRMKNAQSKFAQTLGTTYNSKHRILLTGTPLQNNLPELWALLNFLLPTIFSSVDTFDQWFNKPFAQFRNQTADEAAAGTEVTVLNQEERMLIVHRLHEVLRPFVLRRVKDQVLDQLPEKVEKILRCSLSGWQRKMYHSITVRTLANKAKDSVVSGGLNNTIMQLRKVCNHPYLFIKNYLVDEDLIRIAGKFELLDRMLPKLKAAGHRVLIFSQMVEVMNFLEEFFNYRGFFFLRLDGNTTSEDREKRMYTFNDPNSPYFIFLLSTKAGGLGLNLATADTVIIFDSDWNPMVDAQAQDRAHRIGQKNEVRVFRLLTNSAIEEKILARATDKLNLTGLVVEAGKFGGKTNEFNNLDDDNENKEMMESLLKEYSSGGIEMSGYGNTEQYENNDFDKTEGGGGEGGPGNSDIPDNEQINEMMAAYEGEFDLYQKMDLEFYEREKLLYGLEHARLMKATDKPKWLTSDCWPTKYSILMSDMMTSAPLQTLSKQFTLQSTGPKKKGRKRKNPEGGLASVTADNNDDRADSPSVDTYNDTLDGFGGDNADLVAGKVMRKRKDVKYDDGMTDFQFKKFLEKQADMEETGGEVSFDAGGGGGGGKTGKGRGKRGIAHLNVIVQGCIKAVQDIQKIKKIDGTFLAELFLEKPLKSFYPDYYAIVETPISLKEILSKLRNEEYNFFEEIELDFALMSYNAKLYNGELSVVFLTAESVRREFYLKTTELRQEYQIQTLSDPILVQGDIPPLPPGGMGVGYQIFPKGKSFTGELVLPDSKPAKKKMKLSHSSTTTPNKGSVKKGKKGGGTGRKNSIDNDLMSPMTNDNPEDEELIDDIDNSYDQNDDMEEGEEEDDEEEVMFTTTPKKGGLVLNFGGIKSSKKK
jgi:superfamily II DNA or RNA helicase